MRFRSLLLTPGIPYGNGNNDKGLHPWDGLTEPQLVMGEHYKGTKNLYRTGR